MNNLELRNELMRTAHFVDPLRHVQQDKIWHAEGNAFVHTRMVQSALEDIPEFRDLPESDRNVLRLAAALHDIGKVSTTKEEEGRIVAPKHAKIGELMLQHFYWIKGYEMKAEDRRLLLALVRWHGRPLHQQDRLEAWAAETSNLVPVNLVALLSEADIRGRTCHDEAEQLLKIELFREAARELNCYSTPYFWTSNHAKWKHFQMKPKDLSFQQFDDTTFEVYLPVGLPGSGKSTFSNKTGMPIVSLDVIRRKHDLDPTKQEDNGRASQFMKEEMKELLRIKRPFVLDGTNLVKQFRQSSIGLCTDYGAAVNLIHFDRDRKTVLGQNLGREFVIPEFVIEKMAEKMEFPDASEAHQLLHQ